jgi:hypothetical protein
MALETVKHCSPTARAGVRSREQVPCAKNSCGSLSGVRPLGPKSWKHNEPDAPRNGTEIPISVLVDPIIRRPANLQTWAQKLEVFGRAAPKAFGVGCGFEPHPTQIPLFDRTAAETTDKASAGVVNERIPTKTGLFETAPLCISIEE